MAAAPSARVAQCGRLCTGGPNDEGCRACDGGCRTAAELELEDAFQRLNDRGAGVVHT